MRSSISVLFSKVAAQSFLGRFFFFATPQFNDCRLEGAIGMNRRENKMTTPEIDAVIRREVNRQEIAEEGREVESIFELEH